MSALLTPQGAVASTPQTPVIMSVDGDHVIDLTPFVSYFIDESANLSLDEIISRQNAFQPIATHYIDFGLGEFRVWLHFSLHNPGATEKAWRLDLGRQFVQEIEVFEKRRGLSPTTLFSSHASDPFNARPVKTRTLACPIAVPSGTTIDIYVGYRSASTTSLPMTIGPPAGVRAARGNESNLDAIMNGALFAMIGVALLMTPFTGWRLSLAFALYIFSGVVYVAHADGYTVKYIWPNGLPFNDGLNLTFMLVMAASGFNFARQLFDFKKTFPAYDRFLISFIVTALFFAFLAIFFIEFRWLMVVGYLIIPVGALIQPITGIAALRRSLAGALPYLLGAIFVIFTFAYAVIAHLSPGAFSLDRTLDVGHAALIVESFAFAAAIVIRLLNMQKERDEAKTAELIAVRQKLAMSSALRDAQKQYVKARELSARRQKQLASVSHDLRQPLAMLRRKLHHATGGEEDTANEMHKAIDYLEQLAGRQLLAEDQSAIVERQGDGAIDRFSARVIFDAANQMFAGEAREKGLEFRVHAVGDQIEADAVALMRVISNLVTNAIRNTTEGGVLLGARRRGGRLAIEVWDTGSGFADDEIVQLMKRGAKSQSSDGHGLGLAIVQEITARYDLRFSLRSVKGKGSCARIELPICG
ncbi:MAG: sensor histidine kinase [Parvularculaceae bacterium]